MSDKKYLLMELYNVGETVHKEGNRGQIIDFLNEQKPINKVACDSSKCQPCVEKEEKEKQKLEESYLKCLKFELARRASNGYSDVYEIATYIVNFFQRMEDPVTNLKLQKLLYYVQGWHLALYDKPAFDEPLEAWLRGPVQPNLYKKYFDMLLVSGKSHFYPIVEEFHLPYLGEHLESHIDEVLEEYGTDGAYALEVMCTNETPWMNARKSMRMGEAGSCEITHEDMKEFFKKQLEEQDNE